LEIKRRIFADLDDMTPAHAVLATNSSAIVSSKIADATGRPDKVVNLHFFNPALVMKLVEVVQGPHVSQETADLSMALCEKLGKAPVRLNKEVNGFPAEPDLLRHHQGSRMAAGNGGRLGRRYRQGLRLRRRPPHGALSA
jgi:3-hydroxybutyryl-CoA dehydrogenase